MYASGCLWAYVSSCMSWIWLCLCAWERENEHLRQSLGVSYWDGAHLDLVDCAVVLYCAAVPYKLVFLIGFDVLQPMCTDRGYVGEKNHRVLVQLQRWQSGWHSECYSPLFKLEHSLISCPWSTSVGLDWSVCTLSQAWLLCTVCLLQNSGAIRVGWRQKLGLNWNRSCRKKKGFIKTFMTQSFSY